VCSIINRNSVHPNWESRPSPVVIRQSGHKKVFRPWSQDVRWTHNATHGWEKSRRRWESWAWHAKRLKIEEQQLQNRYSSPEGGVDGPPAGGSTFVSGEEYSPYTEWLDKPLRETWQSLISIFNKNSARQMGGWTPCLFTPYCMERYLAKVSLLKLLSDMPEIVDLQMLNGVEMGRMFQTCLLYSSHGAQRQKWDDDCMKTS